MRSRIVWPVVSALACLSLGAGYVTLDAYDVVPGILTVKPGYGGADRLVEPARVTAGPQRLPGTPGEGHVRSEAVQALVDKLVADLSTPPTQPLTPAPAEGTAPTVPPAPPHISVEVLSASDGHRIASHEPEVAYLPASSTKVPTAATALTLLGPDHTFVTTTLRVGSTLVLRAGGDQLLAPGESNPTAVRGRAGLATLARETAAELAKKQVGSVDLVVDDTIWGDPARHPDWVAAGSVNYAGPIAPVALNTGRVNSDLMYGYVDDPAMAAAQVFRDQLGAAGIAVTSLVRGATPEGATKVAEVRSAPLAEIVRALVKDSDNVLAEGVCRASALAAHQPPTYDGAVQAVRETLTAIGVDPSGYAARDCSGLSENGRISASVLAHTLAATTDANQPRLRSLASALPVAALDGTLHNRLHRTAAAGLVRAKTGLLPSSRSLTGFVPTTSGEVLVFSVVIADYDASQVGRVLDHLDRMIDGFAAL